MEFCPKCGLRLIPKKIKTEDKTEFFIVCRKGDYTKKDVDLTLKPFIANNGNPKRIVAVISRNEQKLNTLPTLKVECPKCGNRKAFVWQLQTRGLDQSSTQFMRCTRCSHTFRDTT